MLSHRRVVGRSRATVFVNGTELTPVRRNAADTTGRESVTIPLMNLAFPY
jgi:hypothetical protein